MDPGSDAPKSAAIEAAFAEFLDRQGRVDSIPSALRTDHE